MSDSSAAKNRGHVSRRDFLATTGTDPSQLVERETSKIVIDATRPLPWEGGRAEFPELKRVLLEKGAPNVFAEVDALYGQVLRDFRRV